MEDKDAICTEVLINKTGAVSFLRAGDESQRLQVLLYVTDASYGKHGVDGPLNGVHYRQRAEDDEPKPKKYIDLLYKIVYWEDTLQGVTRGFRLAHDSNLDVAIRDTREMATSVPFLTLCEVLQEL